MALQALLFGLSLVAGPGSASAQGANPPLPTDPVAAILKSQGIRAVSPASDAADFTLPDLGGREVALSGSKGRWVLLTFFATWCGPCAQEMPHLEQLYQARNDAGLDVIGVAIEPGRDKIAAFAKQKGVTFPVLIDAPGRVAAIYRANSVPISYVIDPAGRIVGVVHGARDWSRATGLIDDLLAARPTDAAVPSAYQSAQAPVDLPSTLIPPDAEVEVGTAEPEVGEPLTLYIRIKWAGDFEDYLLLPPEVHLPEGIERTRTSASTSSQEGRAVVTYRVDLLPRVAGSFALDPVELRFTPRFESQPQARRITGPTVEVAEATIAGLSALGWLVAAAVGGLLIALSVVFVGLRHRLDRRHQEPAPPNDEYTRLAAHLEEARRARLNGDAAAFIVHLQPFEGVLGDGDSAALFEKIRYGGYVPPPQELDQMLRRAQRRVAELAPDTRTEAKRGIKLKPED